VAFVALVPGSQAAAAIAAVAKTAVDTGLLLIFELMPLQTPAHIHLSRNQIEAAPKRK
jgi:hypothetical protein